MRFRVIINDKLKLKAEKRCEEIYNKIFENHHGFLVETNIMFSPNQNQYKHAETFSNEEYKVNIIYNQDWIENNLDYPTLLNNFIYLFEFVDIQMRCLSVSKTTDRSLFEVLSLYSKDSYIDGTAFKQRSMIIQLQMLGYYEILHKYNINLEEIIKWFFEDYLKKEFSVEGFRILIPSEQLRYLEKCKSVLPTIDSIIKQFSYYVQDGEINYELMQISSLPLPYNQIPTLINDKYIYGQGEDYKKITYLLFSDQSLLSFVENKNEYRSFINLITNENIYESDYNRVLWDQIKWLQGKKLIKISINGLVEINDEKAVLIFKDLYYNEVINRYHYSRDMRLKMDELIRSGYIRYGTTLLSESEISYFNYYMNKKDFDNGPELRNKYMHGDMQINEDEKTHKQNYLTFLYLLILLVIKINDEFCLKEKIKDEESLNPNIEN